MVKPLRFLLKNTQSRRHILQLIGSTLAVLTMVLMFGPYVGGDWARFESQAISLLSAQGYVTGGIPETQLPPGYPVFIALVYTLGGNHQVVVGLQLIMLLVATNLVFLSLRQINLKIAFIGMLGVGLNPWLARVASSTMSETLGVFLCALLLWLFSTIYRGHRGTAALVSFGVVSIFLPLTSPATIILCLFLWLILGIKLLPEVRSLVLLLTGTLIVFLPWEVHCTKASGNFCVALYSYQSDTINNDLFRWFRSWAKQESDIDSALHVYANRQNFTLTPDRAFDSEQQREQLTQAILGDKFERFATTLKFAEFARVADDRIRDSPLAYYLTLPLIRTATLWFDMDQLIHVQMEYVGRLSPGIFSRDRLELGGSRALKRVFKALASTAIYPLYICYPLLMLWVLYLAIKNRNHIPLLIVLSIVIYSAISGFYALGEARRNLVFIPAILFLLQWIGSSKRLP